MRKALSTPELIGVIVLILIVAGFIVFVFYPKIKALLSAGVDFKENIKDEKTQEQRTQSNHIIDIYQLNLFRKIT